MIEELACSDDQLRELDVWLIHRQMGRKGLESIENVGPRLAEVVEDLLSRLLTRATEAERC